MILDTTRALQRIAGAMVELNDSVEVRHTSRNRAELLGILASKIAGQAETDNSYESRSEAALMSKFADAMEAQTGVTGAVTYTSLSETELLQIAAGSCPWTGEARYSGSETDHLRSIVGNVTDGNGAAKDIAEPGVPLLTNVQKLSLDPATSVGSDYNISDAFYASGFGDVRDGFYLFRAGEGVWVHQADLFTAFDSDTIWHFGANGSFSNWRVGRGNDTFTESNSVTPNTYPWEDDWTTICTLTHPAHQQLNAASTAQGGVFVAGGTLDGNYLVPIGTDWNLLGLADGAGQRIMPDANGHVFEIVDNDSTPVYYTTNAVATPDLVTTWRNISDDSVASITVSSVSVGDLAAGIRLVDGDSNITTYRVNGALNGRAVLSDLEAVRDDIIWDPNGPSWGPAPGNGRAVGNTAIPSQSNWTGTGSTVTKSNPAGPENWGPVSP